MKTNENENTAKGSDNFLDSLPDQALDKVSFKTPSGSKVTLREHNGEEEGYLSVTKDMETGANFLNYLSAVIVGSSLGKSTFTPAELAKWLVNDKYYCLLKARILVHGPILKFKYEFEKSKRKVAFEQDLREFIWDLEHPETLPVEGYVNDKEPWNSYYPWRVRPYLMQGKETGRELTLRSGKEVRYEFLSSLGEAKIRATERDTLNANVVFTARNLEWKNPNAGGDWLPVQNFAPFSGGDLTDLRKDITQCEPKWDLMIDLKDPSNGEVEYINLLQIPDFFFPSGI